MMGKIAISTLKEQNYEEGVEILKKAGYINDKNTINMDQMATDVVFDEWWILKDEEGNIIHRLSFERYYDGEVTTEEGWMEKSRIIEVIFMIKEKLGISRAEIARKYKIPKRTLQDWELGKRQPPEYVVDLLEKVATQDMKEK